MLSQLNGVAAVDPAALIWLTPSEGRRTLIWTASASDLHFLALTALAENHAHWGKSLGG